MEGVKKGGTWKTFEWVSVAFSKWIMGNGWVCIIWFACPSIKRAWH